MQGLKRLRWPEVFLIVAIFTLLQGCSALPQLVRHRDPLSADEHLRLGTSYEAQGLDETAAQQYQAAIHLQKRNIPALAARGNLAFKKGDWKNAEACYRRILKTDPANAGADNNMAMVYLARGKHLDKAEHWARKALNQGGPLKPYALDTLATIYVQEGHYADAQDALKDAVAAAPADNQPLRHQLAETQEKLNQRQGHHDRS